MTTGIRTITFLENSKRSSDNFGKQRGNIFIRSYRVLHKKRQGSFVTFSCLLLSFLRLSRATQICEDIIEQISKERAWEWTGGKRNWSNEKKKEVHQCVVHLSLSLAISYCARREARVHVLLACVDFNVCSVKNDVECQYCYKKIPHTGRWISTY